MASYPDRAQPIQLSETVDSHGEARMRMAVNLKGLLNSPKLQRVKDAVTPTKQYGLVGRYAPFSVSHDVFQDHYEAEVKALVSALENDFQTSNINKGNKKKTPSQDEVKMDFETMRENVLRAIQLSHTKDGFNHIIVYSGEKDDRTEGLVAVIAFEAKLLEHEAIKNVDITAHAKESEAEEPDSKELLSYVTGSVAAYVFHYLKNSEVPGRVRYGCYKSPREKKILEHVENKWSDNVRSLAVDCFGDDILQIDMDCHTYPLSDNQGSHQRLDKIHHAASIITSGANAAKVLVPPSVLTKI